MISIIFDTETTGIPKKQCNDVSQQPYITELGALKVIGDEVVTELSQLINPGVLIPEEITNINGIKNEDVEGCPSFKQYLPILNEFFKFADILICHNANFDVQMLDIELKRNGVARASFNFPKKIICTVQEYRHEFGRRISLKELAGIKTGRKIKQTHRATDDCNLLNEVLQIDKFYDSL